MKKITIFINAFINIIKSIFVLIVLYFGAVFIINATSDLLYVLENGYLPSEYYKVNKTSELWVFIPGIITFIFFFILVEFLGVNYLLKQRERKENVFGLRIGKLSK